MWISDHLHVIMSLKEFHFDNRKERVRVMDNSLDTVDGITDDEMTRRFQAAVKLSIEKNKVLGLPVSKYDFQNHRAYLQYPDGRKEYEKA
jgi:hypothetical protein